MRSKRNSSLMARRLVAGLLLAIMVGGAVVGAVAVLVG